MRLLFLLMLLLAAAPATARTAAATPSDSLTGDVRTQLLRLSPFARDEVLWLARCIYSESDRADEQRLVAWVVRNRVATQYRGSTYRQVVLEPKQFSAFNAPTARRAHLLGLGLDSPGTAWKRALGIALDVYQADAAQNPFVSTVRHFYSPVSMPGNAAPHWAEGLAALSSEDLGVDPHRFQFFDGIDEGAAATLAGTPSGPAATHAALSERVTTRRDTFQRRLKPSGRVKRPARPSMSRPSDQRDR